jgi:3-oxoacyl-[acyl-carrier protein] reductase
MRSFEGMSIVVTGGGSGIGAGTAAWFVQRGARVTICGRRAEKVRAQAAALGPACRALRADVTDPGDRAALVTAGLEHGGGRLDALVNNAGNMYRGSIDELDQARLEEIFATNVIGPMLLTGLCVEPLRASRGAVVFLGSVHTRRAFPGASPYAATKGAVETLTRVLAAELGPLGIRVSCVRPGAVFTEINTRAGLGSPDEARARLEGLAPAHALGRIGTVEEVAEAIGYCVAAEWTTGDVLTVDGGLGLGVTNA